MRMSVLLALKLLEKVRSSHLSSCFLSFSSTLLTLSRLPRPLRPTFLATGIETSSHAATLTLGRPGVFHGFRSILLQSPSGSSILPTSSLAAGLNYPGVGPEHAWLQEAGRAEYVAATDEEALRAFRTCAETEGIIPALESSHAIWGGMELARKMSKEANIVVVRFFLPLFFPPPSRV